jgi:hypothetical protein
VPGPAHVELCVPNENHRAYSVGPGPHLKMYSILSVSTVVFSLRVKIFLFARSKCYANVL